MVECRRIEVAPCNRVQVAQDVAIERRGDAKRVVVRGLEACDILLRIRTDQQAAAEPAVRTDASQEFERVLGREIADARARVEKSHRARVDGFVHVESPRKIGHESDQFGIRKLRCESRECGADSRRGDIDSDIAPRRERRHQQRGLGAIACAEIHELLALSGDPRDFVAPRHQYRALRARRIVLGQRADRLEQGRSFRVVEIFGRDRSPASRTGRRGAPGALPGDQDPAGRAALRAAASNVR